MKQNQVVTLNPSQETIERLLKDEYKRSRNQALRLISFKISVGTCLIAAIILGWDAWIIFCFITEALLCLAAIPWCSSLSESYMQWDSIKPIWDPDEPNWGVDTYDKRTWNDDNQLVEPERLTG